MQILSTHLGMLKGIDRKILFGDRSPRKGRTWKKKVKLETRIDEKRIYVGKALTDTVP